MKRTLAFTLFLAFAAITTYGQANLNFSVGINYSDYRFENFQGLTLLPRWGHFFGIAPNYQINQQLRVLVDLQYTVRGYDMSADGAPANTATRYSYLDIIPEVEYNVLPFLALGVGVNYGIKLQEAIKYPNQDWEDTKEFGLVSSTDFGLTGKVKVMDKNIFGFARYTYGVSNIADIMFTDDQGQDLGKAKQFTRNLQIGVGYTLNLRKN